MARLEDLTRGASVRGILSDALVTIIDVAWHSSSVVELTYKDSSERIRTLIGRPEALVTIHGGSERADAHRLQSHFIAPFSVEAFKLLGGTLREREPRRYEVTHVSSVIRNRDRTIGTCETALSCYGESPSTKICSRSPVSPSLHSSAQVIPFSTR